MNIEVIKEATAQNKPESEVEPKSMLTLYDEALDKLNECRRAGNITVEHALVDKRLLASVYGLGCTAVDRIVFLRINS